MSKTSNKPAADQQQDRPASAELPTRKPSKLDIIAERLRAPTGASLEALMAATGWQSHSVRAGMTGLRIRPYVLLRKLGTNPGPDTPPISVTIPVRVKRSGRAVRLITQGGQSSSAAADPSILLGIAKGRDWWATLTADPKLSVRTLAQREGLDPGYVGRMLKLAFLDPKLVQQFVSGTAQHISPSASCCGTA
jgi:site-specific DNA recombinase